MLTNNFMQRVGHSSCIRCDFETDDAMSFEAQDAAMMAHLAEKHPNWQTEKLTPEHACRAAAGGFVTDAYKDPDHLSNKIRPRVRCWGCGTLGCVGKHWGNWCFACNVKRIERISASLQAVVASMTLGQAR